MSDMEPTTSGRLDEAAWICHAIAMATGSQEKASLRHVIATADYINHAVPTFSEFRTCFEALQSVGLVRYHRDHCEPSPALRAAYEQIQARDRSVQKQYQALEKWLFAWEQQPTDAGLFEVVEGELVDAATFEASVQAYLNVI